jgi:7-carboxy-7-deazaguanine synthase
VTYLINEIFYTIQGEGYWTGRPAVFVRFSRCNLWTGREQDRARAVCKFCDTNFTDATPYTLGALLDAINMAAPRGNMVVLTGGEPSLQADRHLLDSLREYLGCYVAIETNGTRQLPIGLDWICVSPKANAPLNQTRGDELKVVWPQPLNLDDLYRDTDFRHYWLSPMDGPNLAENTEAAIDRVLNDPRWRLSIQTHKVIGIR